MFDWIALSSIDSMELNVLMNSCILHCSNIAIADLVDISILDISNFGCNSIDYFKDTNSNNNSIEEGIINFGTSNY